MKHTIDAVYENGGFRPPQPSAVPFAESQGVRITIDEEGTPKFCASRQVFTTDFPTGKSTKSSKLRHVVARGVVGDFRTR